MHVSIVQTHEDFDFGDFFADICFDSNVVGCFHHAGAFYVVERAAPESCDPLLDALADCYAIHR